MNFITLKNWKSQTIDGLIFLSLNAQQILQDFISQNKIRLNIDRKYPIILTMNLKIISNLVIPTVNLDGNSMMNIPTDQLKSSIEALSSNGECIPNKTQKSIHLRLLLCFMCGGEKNDVEIFFSQLSSRFSLMITDQSSFLINAFIDRSNRKVKKSMRF